MTAGGPCLEPVPWNPVPNRRCAPAGREARGLEGPCPGHGAWLGEQDLEPSCWGGEAPRHCLLRRGLLPPGLPARGGTATTVRRRLGPRLWAGVRTSAGPRLARSVFPEVLLLRVPAVALQQPRDQDLQGNPMTLTGTRPAVWSQGLTSPGRVVRPLLSGQGPGDLSL